MYVLGTTAPDTMVKSRDASARRRPDCFIRPIRQMPDAPGKHRAMIEQIFAAKELGVNAQEVTRRTGDDFDTGYAVYGRTNRAAVPQNVQVDSAGSRAA